MLIFIMMVYLQNLLLCLGSLVLLEWIEKFKDDVYPNDYIVIRDNIVCKPPKYYDRIYDEFLNGDLEYIKNKRMDLHKEFEWSDLKRSEKYFSIKIKKREGKFNRRIEDI